MHGQEGSTKVLVRLKAELGLDQNMKVVGYLSFTTFMKKAFSKSKRIIKIKFDSQKRCREREIPAQGFLKTVQKQGFLHMH